MPDNAQQILESSSSIRINPERANVTLSVIQFMAATVLVTIPLSAGSLIPIHQFTGPPKDGNLPQLGVIFGKDAALYGVTPFGGSFGGGIAYSLTAPGTPDGTWTEAVLYNFGGGNGYEFGLQPSSALIADKNGALYGVTVEGGTGCLAPACGTVFELTPPALPGASWTETVLYNFQGGNDGEAPEGSLVFGNDGALYGTTVLGGTANQGTVFRLGRPAAAGGLWTETVLYSFQDGIDGPFPNGGLLFGPKGALYGMTYYGGLSSACQNGCGTAFELAPPASPGGEWTESVIYNFTGSAFDGQNPVGGLVFGSKGDLYGATLEVVFRLAPPAVMGGVWTETGLSTFSFPQELYARPVFGADGALYGTSLVSVYKLVPPTQAGDLWTETTLQTFGEDADIRCVPLVGGDGTIYFTVGQDQFTQGKGRRLGWVFGLTQ